MNGRTFQKNDAYSSNTGKATSSQARSR